MTTDWLLGRAPRKYQPAMGVGARMTLGLGPNASAVSAAGDRQAEGVGTTRAGPRSPKADPSTRESGAYWCAPINGGGQTRIIEGSYQLLERFLWGEEGGLPTHMHAVVKVTRDRFTCVCTTANMYQWVGPPILR